MPKRILIVKPSSLGDIIHSLPLLNAIKTALPDAVVHWVVAQEFSGVLEDHPLIDRLWVIRKQGWKNPLRIHATIAELQRLVRNLRKESFDLTIDLQGLFRSGLITAAAGATERIGFSDARELSPLFYNSTVEGGTGVHAVDRYLKVAALMGIEVDEIVFPLPEVPAAMPLEKPYYVVAPGSRWPTKQWPVEHFIEVINSLAREAGTRHLGSAHAVIVGSDRDRPLAAEITSRTNGDALDMSGKTDLRMLMSIIKEASFLVTNDSGPMHMAAALGVPVFGIFGPTSELLTGPYGNTQRVIKSGIECSPCFKRTCKTLLCMKEVAPERVLEKITEDLNQHPPQK